MFTGLTVAVLQHVLAFIFFMYVFIHNATNIVVLHNCFVHYAVPKFHFHTTKALESGQCKLYQ